MKEAIARWWRDGHWAEWLWQGDPWSFTHLSFWGFFFAVLLIQSKLEQRKAARNAFLFLASLWFYWKTSGWFFTLLLATTVMGFFVGGRIHRASSRGVQQGWLGLGVGLSLAFLLFFKYAYFFSESFEALTGMQVALRNPFAGLTNAVFQTGFDPDRIVLPIGISFFTFQSISYVVDIYRGEVEPAENLVDYGFFVSFFPQLVAGPIVRAKDFMPQLRRPSVVSHAAFGMALFWILNGLMKKVWLGDGLALMLVDRVFANPTSYTPLENVWALYGYSLQVYADFSGYTDIAMGVALLLGFHLPQNFNSPYKAQHLGDFWRRWHMSLSGWLRDYLYIPMGGNRQGSLFTWIALAFVLFFLMLLMPSLGGWMIAAGIGCLWMALGIQFPRLGRWTVTTFNLMLTMLIGGLWHGASWNFVVWGGLNGMGLVVAKFWRRINPFKGRAPWLGILLTFHFVTLTRVWFRTSSTANWEDLGGAHDLWSEWLTANDMLMAMSAPMNWALLADLVSAYATPLILLGTGMTIHWLPERWKRRYRLSFAKSSKVVQGFVCLVVAGFLWERLSTGSAPFIYFQF